MMEDAIVAMLADMTRHGPMSLEYGGETWDLAFGNDGRVLATQTDPDTGEQEERRFELRLTPA